MNVSDIMRVLGYTAATSNPNATVVNATEELNVASNPTHASGNGETESRSVSKQQHPYRIFASIVSRDMHGAIPLRQRTTPKIVGGKLAIAIKEDEYVKGLSQFICCLIGRLVLSKGDHPIETQDLKNRESTVWGVSLTHGSSRR